MCKRAALSGMGLNEGLSWIAAKVTGSGSNDGISTFLEEVDDYFPV